MDSTFEIDPSYGKLIGENNKLQKLVTDLNLRWDICQIVVIGSQSAGKSSVLEKIVGKNFLPTGNGCVTRRPLRLKLFQSDRSSAEISYYNPEKNTIVKQNDLKLNELTEAIRQANSFKNSHCKFIPNPINVTISGPQNPNLTLIDFPGVVANDDRKVIMDMIKPVISKDTSIILAVSSANDDFENSNAIHLAEEADPLGERTIGVLTKVDIIQMSTYTDKLIEFRKRHKSLKYIAVQNSPDKKMKDAKSEESDFFKMHNDFENGTQQLKKIITMELIKKINETIPKMGIKIKKNLYTIKGQLKKFQDLTDEDFQEKLIYAMTREFGEKFNAEIGYASSSDTPDVLSHGAMIYEILYKWFSQNGIIWNSQQKEGQQWYLKNSTIQENMIKDINTKQRNVRGAFNFTASRETTMQNIIRKELENMIEMPRVAIEELLLHLKKSYIATLKVLSLDDNYRDYPKLFGEMEKIIEEQVEQAESGNDYQIRRYFNQEKGYINFGLKDFNEHLIPISFDENAEDEDQLSRESGSTKLNILNFENDRTKREKVYKSLRLNEDFWADDAIILEGSLKYLQIIQNSLSDKLPKIIHYEIFESTKMFVKNELHLAMIDVWKQKKEILFSDDNRREQKQQLENDIEINENALEIIDRMNKIIRSFENQQRHNEQIDENDLFIQD